MAVPDVAGWTKIATDFQSRWQFPHCVGSIDGKHVVMQAPNNSGSLHFNYKKTHSIVLLAVVDANYNFIIVDVGAYGRQSDASVFANSAFGKKLKNNKLPLPEEKPLPRTMGPQMPFIFVGDEAFPLQQHMMRPFPGKLLPPQKRIFNYRLSRARRIVENAFGILAARFRVFRRPLMVSVENAETVVKGAVVLHNFLRQETATQYLTPKSVDHEDDRGHVSPGEWRQNINDGQQLQSLARSGRKSCARAVQVRDLFAQYFSSEVGKVAWQTEIVNRR